MSEATSFSIDDAKSMTQDEARTANYAKEAARAANTTATLSTDTNALRAPSPGTLSPMALRGVPLWQHSSTNLYVLLDAAKTDTASGVAVHSKKPGRARENCAPGAQVDHAQATKTN